MSRTVQNIREIIECGLGKIPCDLKLENVQLVNVFSGEIYPTDIYIKGKRIVSIDPHANLHSARVIRCEGQFALPGLMDAHMHFESTMLSPEALTDMVVPCGTTTLFADMMEIANVAGKEGLQAMIASANRLPYRMLIEVSSRVPTAPGLETTGAVLGAKEVEEIMGWENSVSLGEMDPSKILFVKEEYLHKISSALAQRKIVNGHAIGRLGQELNVYASSGISDDHECVNTQELLARLRVGMKVFIREGSTERNLDELISGVLREHLDFDNLMFCTDDKDVGDMKKEGHINYNVNRATELGVPPVKAIQMATINIAKHFRLEDELGSITPGRLADILLVDDIRNIQPNSVFFEGTMVAEHGVMTESTPKGDYPAWIKHTAHLKNPINAASFEVKVDTGMREVKSNVIGLIDRQIINHHLQAMLPVKNGLVQSDLSNDILKLSVVERYGKTGGVGTAFVQGFTLKDGALAYSMSHDHHNIVVVGTNDIDMAAAANAVAQIQGGLVAARDGAAIASMCLPIGGLMSEKSAQEVQDELTVMNKAANALGCRLPSPFMTLSFISLPTVPELGMTDMGLVDVLQQQLIDTILE